LATVHSPWLSMPSLMVGHKQWMEIRRKHKTFHWDEGVAWSPLSPACELLILPT
jgi:hypothetical protein